MNLNHTIIGALHLAPLHGYEEFPGEKQVIELALADLQAFQDGGVDAIIYENNYDLPHHEKISIENYQLMLRVGRALKDQARIPLGVNVLWNDYDSALKLAKELQLDFIRVPVFVDDVETSYGTFRAVGEKVRMLRDELKADQAQIYADIHVKHSKVISTHTIEESARFAIEAGADGLIVTGKWTGDSPDMQDLRRVREAVGDFPIIVGSGANKENIQELFTVADGAIVSTALKEGAIKQEHTNLSEWQQRIDQKKVTQFTSAAKA
ncbi:BtpA/SgcQ family protein [Candidatus Saccharibacteria bacterium]|nr:BtpA/SgcQ family protein [Candidatus Saccharibacteria bacterium]